MISDEVEERMQSNYFMRQHVRGARQKVLMEQMLKDPAVQYSLRQQICIIKPTIGRMLLA